MPFVGLHGFGHLPELHVDLSSFREFVQQARWLATSEVGVAFHQVTARTFQPISNFCFIYNSHHVAQEVSSSSRHDLHEVPVAKGWMHLDFLWATINEVVASWFHTTNHLEHIIAALSTHYASIASFLIDPYASSNSNNDVISEENRQETSTPTPALHC